jgi:hypothetical protein
MQIYTPQFRRTHQVHPAVSMALLDAVRWHVHGYDK